MNNRFEHWRSGDLSVRDGAQTSRWLMTQANVRIPELPFWFQTVAWVPILVLAGRLPCAHKCRVSA